jgi:hypothetical protein
VTWTTDAPTDSTVEYGLTTAYGQTAGAAGLTTSHAVTLSGLAPATRYYVRVTSKAPGGAIARSATNFTTAKPTPNITIRQASLVRSGTGSAAVVDATVTLSNGGTGDAAAVTVTASNLSGRNTTTPRPIALGAVPIGGTATVTLRYSAPPVGTSVVLKLSGTFTGGTFSVASATLTVP